jgi:hypothetical protein
MNFPVKLFAIKGNLVFMNNLYHKVAVASVCTALGRRVPHYRYRLSRSKAEINFRMGEDYIRSNGLQAL